MVTTPSRHAESLAKAPGTTVVINKEDIRLRGYSTLKDVLRDLPGMDIAENFFSVIGTQVTVRGIPSSNKIVVLVNGMRVNPPGDEFFPLHSDISVRGAEQVEVSYGPSSTLYGQDAAGAVINIITRASPADRHPAVSVGGEAGRGREREAWLSFGQSFGAAKGRKFTGYVQYHDSDLRRLDKEFPRWWQDFAAVAAPKGRGTIPDRLDFGLNGFARLEAGNLSLQSWYRESDRSSSEGYGGAALGFVPEARWADRSWVTEGLHTAKISDAVTLESRVSYNWYQVEPQSRFVFEATPTTWFLDDFKYADGYSIGVDESLRATLSPTVSLVAGAVYTRYDIIPKSTIPGGARPGSHDDIVRQGGAFIYYTEAGNPASRHDVPRVVEYTYGRYGGYADVDWQIAPKLKVVAGVRLDKDSRVDALTGSPRVALVHAVTDALVARYIYAEAYVSPAPYFNAPFDRGDILSIPNPNLKPEKSRAHEVSVTYTKPAYRLSFSAYAGRQSSLILASDTALPPTLLNPVFVDLAGTQRRELVNSVNGGASRTSGADLYGRGTVARGLDSWFSYSYTSYKESTAGVNFGLRGLSRHNVRLGATWTAVPKLSVTPSLVARSTPENLPAGPLDDALRAPWEINLHVLYAAVRHLELYADLRNVTDHHYAVGGFTAAIPQEPFSGVIGARLSF